MHVHAGCILLVWAGTRTVAFSAPAAMSLSVHVRMVSDYRTLVKNGKTAAARSLLSASPPPESDIEPPRHEEHQAYTGHFRPDPLCVFVPLWCTPISVLGRLNRVDTRILPARIETVTSTNSEGEINQ